MSDKDKMDIIAVIPARYNSTRFEGKPLADICGKPMVWWVYTRLKMLKEIDEVYVACDSPIIQKTCFDLGLKCVMTSPLIKTSTERVYQVARKIRARLYVCVNGDEPLIDPGVVKKVIPASADGFFASNLMTKIKSPAQVVDNTNIKVAASPDGYALFMSRSPIPYPKATLDFDYYKHLGVLCYSISALRFFAKTPKGAIETAEDINELRFIEHAKKLRMIEVEADTLSVDTPKDLEYVRKIIAEKIKRGELAVDVD